MDYVPNPHKVAWRPGTFLVYPGETVPLNINGKVTGERANAALRADKVIYKMMGKA